MRLLLTSPNQELVEKVGHCLSTLLHIPYYKDLDGNLKDDRFPSDSVVVTSHPIKKASEEKDLAVYLHQGQDIPCGEIPDSLFFHYDLILDQSCLGTTGTIELLKQFYVTKLMQSRSLQRSSNM